MTGESLESLQVGMLISAKVVHIRSLPSYSPLLLLLRWSCANSRFSVTP
jgi:hypothetical protein